MDWTEQHVRRLFWRAGFGATPEEATHWAAAGRKATLRWVLDGTPGAKLAGPAPVVNGKPLDPLNEWGHDGLWWIDRMIRSPRPLVEKLTLFWHDHFATADQDTPLMLAQNRMLRRYGLGRFRALLGHVARDPAMQLFLSLTDNDKDAPNENFARELMELFTLASGYTERDIREAARALTGWQGKWDDNGFHGIVYVADRHDSGIKRVLGKRGRLGTDDVLDLVCAHPRHAPYLTRKLWDFFVTRPPDAATARRLVAVYRAGGGHVKPVVAEILGHPLLYADLDAPDMVKAPVVLLAGHLRTAGAGITTDSYTWLLSLMGQQLFSPPSVAGWEWGPAWLTTNSVGARFTLANYLLRADADSPGPLPVPDGTGDPKLTAADQVDTALDALGRPWISASSRQTLVDLAAGFYADLVKPWEIKTKPQRADMLQRVLRHLVLTGPDAHLH
ncbi:MAG: hypothetical protein QOG68_2657 [Solirubrobacteraceae bacterium]|nr:hypothetical protein [Solirubrobacteraceae bacterium]